MRTFKERAIAALEQYMQDTKGVIRATIADCLTLIRWLPEESDELEFDYNAEV